MSFRMLFPKTISYIEHRLALAISGQKELENNSVVRNRLLQAMLHSSNIANHKRLRSVLHISFANLLHTTLCYSMQRYNIDIALEMIHTYSLIHDDLPSIDNDDYRGGVKSCHREFDEPTAILAGDALLTLSFETILLACFYSKQKDIDLQINNELLRDANEKKLQVLLKFTQICGKSGLLFGQMMDLKLINNTNNLSDTRNIDVNNTLLYNEVSEIAKYKTGGLFILSSVTAGIINNASEEIISVLAEFGDIFGQVFQMLDDAKDINKQNDNYNFIKLCGIDAIQNKTKQYIDRMYSIVTQMEEKYLPEKKENFTEFSQKYQNNLESFSQEVKYSKNYDTSLKSTVDDINNNLFNEIDVIEEEIFNETHNGVRKILLFLTQECEKYGIYKINDR